MILAIVQARTGSTRLPNKVFLDLCGKPLIWHIVKRLSYSKYINQIVIATTINPNDNIIEKWCNDNEIAVFRGSEENVLSRFYQCAKHYNADIVVRITSDDPFKDPIIIDQIITLLLNDKLDFVYNNYPPSFPEGLDTEVFTFEALNIANKDANDLFEKEHVTQHFYRHPDLFKQRNIYYKENLSYLRWTLDTFEDYNMIKKIYEGLYKENQLFLMNDILQYIDDNPEVKILNKNVKRSAMYS